MLKQIKYENSIGKTIEFVSSIFDSLLIFKFTDNTFAALHAVNNYEETDIEDAEVNMGDYSNACIEAGVYSLEEYQAFNQKKLDEHNELIRRTELKKLKELKAKYPEA